MIRTRIIVAALAALALAAPAASADPHAIDSHVRAQQGIDSPAGELRARGRDGVQTGSRAGTTDAIARAHAQEKAYSTYGEPVPVEPAPAPAKVTADDSEPWPLIGAGFLGIALLVGAAVALVARPRRTRAAA